MQPQFRQMPPKIIALDDRGLEAELRRADGADIAAGAGADDDDVEGCVGHSLARRCGILGNAIAERPIFFFAFDQIDDDVFLT